jgi:hypothetical protein
MRLRFLKAAKYIYRPVHLIRRVAYEFYQFRHPEEPWMAQEAVRFCNTALKQTDVALEWGSGRSTKWFAARVGKLLSVEFDSDWYRKVSADLASFPNAQCRFVPLEHAPDEGTVAHYEKISAYVAVVDEFADGSLDFVVIDGHYRQACILGVLPKLKSQGLLLVDNTDWLPLADWGVPPSWPIVHQSRNVLTQTTIWQKPSRPLPTSIAPSTE